MKSFRTSSGVLCAVLATCASLIAASAAGATVGALTVWRKRHGGDDDGES